MLRQKTAKGLFFKGLAIGCAAGILVASAGALAAMDRTEATTTEPSTTTTKVAVMTLAKVEPTTKKVKATRPDTALDPAEIELIARTIWGEAEGVVSQAEQAAVAWCVLNRVDASGQTIEQVVTAPNQFLGYYRVKGEVPDRFWRLACDVLNRWNAEKRGTKNVGRVLPADYLYFIGDGERNYFSKEWKATDYWGWTLKSPY